jgi:hypothetical protein
MEYSTGQRACLGLVGMGEYVAEPCIETQVAALRRGGAVSRFCPCFWGDIDVEGIFGSHVNSDRFFFRVRAKILAFGHSPRANQGARQRRGGGGWVYIQAEPKARQGFFV